MSDPREGYVPVENGALYYREVGQGQPIILLHGGPDFDHQYLLPDMDRLSDSYRLIYYDQRGRGKSGRGVQPEDVTIKSEIEDLEAVRKHFQLDSAAILGHSWGGLLAMEYAIHYPSSVSHIILMDTAPAVREDWVMLRQELRQKKSVYEPELSALVSSAAYQEGDPEAVMAYYRMHFGMTIKRPEHLERVLENMQFIKENVLRERAIENRLYEQTLLLSDFDLTPQLNRLTIPTLVIHGDYDFIPAKFAARIAQSIPGARFVLLQDCGHFAYVESPDKVRKAIADFFAG